MLLVTFCVLVSPARKKCKLKILKILVLKKKKKYVCLVHVWHFFSSVCQNFCLPVCLFVGVYARLPVCLCYFPCLSVYLCFRKCKSIKLPVSIYPSAYLLVSICLFIYLATCQFTCATYVYILYLRITCSTLSSR